MVCEFIGPVIAGTANKANLGASPKDNRVLVINFRAKKTGFISCRIFSLKRSMMEASVVHVPFRVLNQKQLIEDMLF